MIEQKLSVFQLLAGHSLQMGSPQFRCDPLPFAAYYLSDRERRWVDLAPLR